MLKKPGSETGLFIFSWGVKHDKFFQPIKGKGPLRHLISSFKKKKTPWSQRVLSSRIQAHEGTRRCANQGMCSSIPNEVLTFT